MPSSFISGLKTAASTPYAFVAYVCLLTAWVYVGIAQQRLKHISKAIGQVPQKDRAALLAKEYNVLPRSGLSAEQWIRSRKHMLVFLAFLALLVAGVLLIAIALSLRKQVALDSSSSAVDSYSSARIRIIDALIVPMSQSGAAFPALNIYYDNAGPAVARGIVSRFGAGFGGQLSDEAIFVEQDKLLHWEGWKSAMDRRQQYEMHPGDPGEFTSIPNMEGELASQFRQKLDQVSAGKTVLYVFVTFKFINPSGRVGVTENCFWFSNGLARHDCGRGRTFLEH
jgi:hypothetical protein